MFPSKLCIVQRCQGQDHVYSYHMLSGKHTIVRSENSFDDIFTQNVDKEYAIV